MRTEKTEFNRENILFRFGDLTVNLIFAHFMPANPEWTELKHCHSSYEFHIIPNGSGKLFTADKTYNISGGIAYVTGPEVYHRQKTDVNNPMTEYCLNIELQKAKNASQSRDASQNEMQKISDLLFGTTFWFGSDTNGLAEICEQMLCELEKKQIGCYQTVKALLIRFLIGMARNYCCETESSLTKQTVLPEKSLDDMRLAILDNYFYFHYSEKITLSSLASKIGVGERQLSRIIKKRYKTTFKEKLTSVRLENAKELLAETDLTIEEICSKTGFCSASYFIKTFRRFESKPPSQYRKIHRIQSEFYS